MDVLSDFLRWLADQSDSARLVERLQELDPSSLERLGVLARLGELRQVLTEWESRLDLGDEEYWQGSLERHAFVLTQVIGSPVLVIKGKAYVGGKSVENTGGHIADYLAKNSVTENALVVELKTPATALLQREEYRNGVFPPSRDLAGAVTQTLTYRDSLVQDRDRLQKRSTSSFHAFRPRGLVIIGNAAAELETPDQVGSFELFRGELKDVAVVTFDELMSKLRQLIEALETGARETTV
jgi:hypothetical protein